MPSTRLNCGACDFKGYCAPSAGDRPTREERNLLQQQSAQATAHFAGFNPDLPDGIDEDLKARAKKCALTISMGECAMWRIEKAKEFLPQQNGPIHKDY